MEENEIIKKLPKWRQYTLMELPTFLILTALALSGTVVSDLIVFQTCRKILGEAKNYKCEILHTNSSSEEAIELVRLVQPLASYILMWKGLVEGVLPAFLSLFLGPWSDKYGRKPLLIAAYTGSFLMYVLMTILSKWDVDPWIFLIAFIPSSLLGGVCVLMLATFCYLTDITNNDTRAWRLAWFEACLSIGLVVGIFIGPMIFKIYGYTKLFIVSSTCSGCSLLFIIFFVPETVFINRENQKWGSVFDFKLVKELIETSTKEKVGLNRKSLWGCIITLALLIVILNGDISVGYLFTSARLGWNTIEYSRFKGLSIAISIIGTIIGVRLFGRTFGFSDTALAMIAAVSSFTASMITAFTLKPWHMYTVLFAGSFGGVLSPTIRSVLSKSVPPEDVGKVFSLATSVEAILPLICGPIYTLIYAKYLPPFYPSPVYLLSSTILLFIIIIICYIEKSINKSLTIFIPLGSDEHSVS
ncbi:hypothetical protein HCN44_003262 [Aphidius gifuensis]|uniref:MFS transporter n=1 Tax=Aphidius gifuensis TaxID=684658 RepID=A0A835CNW5_APHGI|nr:proton-coupled folate transporter-like [Aphidius gifuensis]KAF7987500.1 hypothetical protein HCN44_003262 [Aphidius gifuensis]